MRPPPRSAAAFWIVREQADFNCLKPLFESTQTRAFVATAPPKPTYAGKLLLILPEGERYTQMSMKLYVGNLAFQTSSSELQELFAQAGTVESASVVEDRDTGRSRGFGFVEMATKEEGQAAIAQLNGKEARRPQAGRRRPRRLRRRQPIRRRRQPWRRGRQPRASLVAAAGQTATLYTERLWR